STTRSRCGPRARMGRSIASCSLNTRGGSVMPLFSLWIPVLASAVVVFVISSILHMVLKYHSADYKRLPNEDAVRDALGKGALPPGLYQLPYCANMKAMQEPANKAKCEQGPIGVITIIPNGLPAMPKYLAQWFL